MPLPRRPKSRAQQVAREGSPCHGVHCGRPGGSAQPPPVQLPQLRCARSARRSEDSGWSGGGADWWQPCGYQVPASELGLGRRRSPLRLPPLPPNATVAQRAARNRAVLKSVLLPPLHPPPERRDPPRPAARADSLGAVLGELLPPKFREFLHHLNQLSKAVEQSPPPTPPDYLRQRFVSRRSVHQCPRCSCSFRPDLRDQSPHLQGRFRKNLLHPVRTVCSLKESSELTTVKQTPQPQCPPAPRLRAVLSQSCSSGQSSGSSRRGRHYRVRFADETLGDSALRYWERSCAARQSLNSSTAAPPERLRQSLAQWLDDLSSRRCPQPRSALELSEKAHVTNPPPFTPRAAPQSPGGTPKTPLRCHRLLDLVDKPNCYWSRKLEAFLPSLVLNTILK